MPRSRMLVVTLTLISMIFLLSYISSENQECGVTENVDELLLEPKKCSCKRKRLWKDLKPGEKLRIDSNFT
jgi:hypothetical protein